MDVGRYSFDAQKAIHGGIRLAKSYGHPVVEIEHVALAIVKSRPEFLAGGSPDDIEQTLRIHLDRFPKVFGIAKFELGPRLRDSLEKRESMGRAGAIGLTHLWQSLVANSTAIKNSFLSADEDVASPTVEPYQFKAIDPPDPRSGGKGQRAEKPSLGRKIEGEKNKVLERFTVDVSRQAEAGELDPVIGRDVEIRRVLEVLGRKKKNNPILLGPPGTGKTAIIEGLALKIASGTLPEPLKSKRVLTLDLGALIAGAKYRGEFEQRLKEVMDTLKQLSGDVILFIDEIHTIIGLGSHEGGADAANLLKPALARGELHCVGATTYEEYRKYIAKDSALERRFQPVSIEEPSRDQAVSILRGLKSKYEIHHGVPIDDDAVCAAVEYSIRYLPDRKLPDKAIDLIDEACSRVRFAIDSVPEELETVYARIEQLEIERSALESSGKAGRDLKKIATELEKLGGQYQELEGIWSGYKQLLDRSSILEQQLSELDTLYSDAKSRGDYHFAAQVKRERIPALHQELRKVQEDLADMSEKVGFVGHRVERGQIAEVIAGWSGIPVDKVLSREDGDISSLLFQLKERVFGQDEALEKVYKAVRRARAGVNDPKRPLGVFLFMGPTGIGKTETAKALAEQIFANEDKIIRFDMSEYMEKHNVARLIGAPPGYVGFGDGGELTEAVRRAPYSVVLFDEMEKAHPQVLDILLQVFEDGRLSDGQGRTVDFRNTLIIMTSNIPLKAGQGSPARIDLQMRQALTGYLKPEFINRIDEVVVFRDLRAEDYVKVVERELAALNARLLGRDLNIILGERLMERLVDQALEGSFGGRAIRRAFQSMVTDPVSDKVVSEDVVGRWLLDIHDLDGYVWIEKDRRELPRVAGD